METSILDYTGCPRKNGALKNLNYTKTNHPILTNTTSIERGDLS